MAAPLTGLGNRPTISDLPRCACGCGQAAPRGFSGDVHYAHACVPPHLRYPWEPGHVPAAGESALPAPAPIAAAAASDLFGSIAA